MHTTEAKKIGAKSRLVMEYMDVKRQLKELGDRREQLKSKIELHMSFKKTDILYCGSEYVEQTESPSVTVNTKKFYKLVSDGVFLDSVSVPVSKARKVLSEEELNRVTVVKNNTKLITGTLE